MPSILRLNEEKTLYPVRRMMNRHYDPYHCYFLIRKEKFESGQNYGMLKDVSGFKFIAWLDSNSATKIQEDSYDHINSCVLHYLQEDFEIIEITNEEHPVFEKGDTIIDVLEKLIYEMKRN